MATPFRIKRSAVPGKAPAVSDLQLGELALNTYDAELYTLRSRPGIGTEVVKIGGAAIENVLYVNKDGDDGNSGSTPADAKATLKAAVGIASEGTAIKIAAGTYIENNPIKVPKQVSIVGDSLREVTISPQNADKDMFHVSPGDMISEITSSYVNVPPIDTFPLKEASPALRSPVKVAIPTFIFPTVISGVPVNP